MTTNNEATKINVTIAMHVVRLDLVQLEIAAARDAARADTVADMGMTLEEADALDVAAGDAMTNVDAWCECEYQHETTRGLSALRATEAATIKAIMVEGKALAAACAKACRRAMPRDVAKMYDDAIAGHLGNGAMARLLAHHRRDCGAKIVNARAA